MRYILRIMLLAAAGVAISCNQKPSQDAAHSADRKHFEVKGRVVSVDKQSRMVNVDGEAIPGYMDAMTMPYSVRPESELERLRPGDRITADLLVEDDRSWLENIRVISPSSPVPAR